MPEILRLPYRQTDNPFPVNVDLAGEMLDKGLLHPDLVREWTFYGLRPLTFPNPLTDKELSDASLLRRRLSKLQTEGKLIAAMQDGNPATRGDFVHVFTPGIGNNTSEYFRGTFGCGTTDHRIYVCTERKDTLAVASNITTLALDSNAPLHFKYIQQGTGRGESLDQIDQIVFFLDSDNWKEGLKIAKEASKGLVEGRPVPYIAHELQPGIGYIPDALHNHEREVPTPFIGVSNQLHDALVRSISRTIDVTNPRNLANEFNKIEPEGIWTVPAWSALLKVQSLKNPTKRDIAMCMVGVDPDSERYLSYLLAAAAYSAFSEDERQQVFQDVPLLFDDPSISRGYEATSLRANKGSVLNSDIWGDRSLADFGDIEIPILEG